MISSIELSAFKRVQRHNFNLRSLTVLAGLNGAGKTSLIQSLLLLSEVSSERRRTVRLNGPFDLELGTAEDVRNWRTDGLITCELIANECGYKWEFSVPSPEAMFLSVINAPDTVPTAFCGRPRAFTYLSADRLGPRSSVVSSARPAEELEVGVRGENTAHMLAALGNSRLPVSNRTHPLGASLEPTLFKYEIETWMSEIVRPIEVDAETFPGPMVSVLRFRKPGADWVRAANMGYGVSYALPVVLGGLSALEGGMLIVENPEAHLHPAGQSRMGVFLAWLAGKGVQVVVETHSDHVLNGVRLAIAHHKFLGSESAIVQYFDADEKDDLVVSELEFSPRGSVSHWPKGFFDQYQLDVATLGQIRRRG